MCVCRRVGPVPSEDPHSPSCWRLRSLCIFPHMLSFPTAPLPGGWKAAMGARPEEEGWREKVLLGT